jgi:hypothetical protein
VLRVKCRDVTDNPEKPSTIHGLTWDDVVARHGLSTSQRVGDGWADLVDRLFTNLETMGWRWTAGTRFEEKYGELLFEPSPPEPPPSYEGWSSAWDDRIEQAERESDRTCSECGRPGDEVVIKGWVYKLCPTCASAQEAESGGQA